MAVPGAGLPGAGLPGAGLPGNKDSDDSAEDDDDDDDDELEDADDSDDSLSGGSELGLDDILKKMISQYCQNVYDIRYISQYVCICM